MPASPTARTLAKARSLGWVAERTERWIPQARRRKDLFGWIDVLALDPLSGRLLGLQATTGDNVASRVAKVAEWPHLAVWLAAGNGAEVWGWAKRGARGERKLWTLRRIRVSPNARAERNGAREVELPFADAE